MPRSQPGLAVQTGTAPSGDGATAEDSAPHLRWNFTVMGLDIAFFVGGISFSAWSTILPLFVRHLTASNLILGLVPAVRNLGTYLPPIFVIPFVDRLRRYKPYILWNTTLERLPFLALAMGTLLLGTGHPALLLALFFLMVATWSIAAGVTTPAWLHMVSLMIPTRVRGRFFGLASSVGGVLGVVGSALTALILASYPFPRNFALCFLATFVLLAASFAALALGREPLSSNPGPQGQPGTLAYLRTLPAFLRRHPNFARFLLASVLGNTGLAISPFLAAAASRQLHVSDGAIGVYSGVLLATSTVGSLTWGWLGDHLGYKPVLLLGSLAGTACMATAVATLASGQTAWLALVFVLLGAYSSATQLASFTVVMEFGGQAERPTFIALSTLVLAPVALGAPLAGGWLADHSGFGAIFTGAAALMAMAALVFGYLVHDPRLTRVPRA